MECADHSSFIWSCRPQKSWLRLEILMPGRSGRRHWSNKQAGFNLQWFPFKFEFKKQVWSDNSLGVVSVSAEGCLWAPWAIWLPCKYLFALEGPHVPVWERALAYKGRLWKETFAHKSPWDSLRCHRALSPSARWKNLFAWTRPTWRDAIPQTCTAAKLTYTTVLPTFTDCTYIKLESWRGNFSRLAKILQTLGMYLHLWPLAAPPRSVQIGKVIAPS